MYDYAVKVLKDAKSRIEEQIKAKSYDSVEDAIIDRGYICDIDDALMTLESISEDPGEGSDPKYAEIDRSMLI